MCHSAGWLLRGVDRLRCHRDPLVAMEEQEAEAATESRLVVMDNKQLASPETR